MGKAPAEETHVFAHQHVKGFKGIHSKHVITSVQRGFDLRTVNVSHETWGSSQKSVDRVLNSYAL